jgi:hypothetical protein
MPEPLEDLAIDRVADSAGLTDETDWEALYPDIEATR